MLIRRRWKGALEPPPYKLLSILLQYPDERILGARTEILEAVDCLSVSPHREGIARFHAYWAGTPSTTLAQTYVQTFDLQKRSGMYLSYYLYGDTRKRGMALLRLKRMYRAAGLILEEGELPDYLPAMLEFAALAPPGYGETVLGEYRAALALIQTSLHEMGSPYAHLLDALCGGLRAVTPAEQAFMHRLIADGPPSEQVGLAPFAPPEVMPAREVRR